MYHKVITTGNQVGKDRNNGRRIDQLGSQVALIFGGNKQRDAIQKVMSMRESSSETNVSLALVSYFASIREEVNEGAGHRDQ